MFILELHRKKKLSYAIAYAKYVLHWLYEIGHLYTARRVWRWQRGNQNPHIEEEQTTLWRKEKEQKDKQRSTKHTYKTKDRVTLKTVGEPRCSGRVGSSCSTSDTCRVNLVTKPMVSHEWGNTYHYNSWYRYKFPRPVVSGSTLKMVY